MRNSTALKKKKQNNEYAPAEIIPWPDVSIFQQPTKKAKPSRVRLDAKYLYYKGKRIPILQFQKAGYDKILKLLVKEIGG